MATFMRYVLPAILCSALQASAAGLPDTGQTACYDDTAVDSAPAAARDSIARDSGTHPRQDCRYGRDAAYAAGTLSKTGAGTRGFDYTKVANNGAALDAGAAPGPAAGDWACTRDNITGLTWEVKTAAGADLRHTGHSYAWLNNDGNTNGGDAGSIGSDTCGATLAGGLCNTGRFVAAVNAIALCTFNDWRLPTRRELATLIRADGARPAIDPSHFPNTNALYWTANSYTPVPAHAWLLDFLDGKAEADAKSSTYPVRLVRGGPF